MAVTDEAIDRIKKMIVTGELRPGTRLPKEDDLAQQLGLSRNSLREAVRALTAMKILIPKQGDGTYVSSLEPHLLLETLSFASDVSHGQTALQLLQVRRLLEPPATALAVGRITDEDLTRLRSILDRSTAAESPEAFVRLDMEFHSAIVGLSGNPVLSMLLQVVSTQTQRIRILRGASVGPAIENAHRDHEAILAALASRDAQLAASAAAVHVSSVEQWLAQSLGTDGEAGPAPG
ncbi:FCD domain-containing protein [Streptomyces sp. Li-HN-5-11]|uniref:FadR/GntR family transcriptional regulator n=1 Tax=Streptomyces sp. Li-HN-5-11 TaxID=3075432 RepID=UPI0028A98493|nr:FCD domain-containing protein [Streptomyces sp. Li-HN-5-11]WNM33378.1 FCD domain-containing protein [Streptomyces sp. Li-HN-5-11]